MTMNRFLALAGLCGLMLWISGCATTTGLDLAQTVKAEPPGAGRRSIPSSEVFTAATVSIATRPVPTAIEVPDLSTLPATQAMRKEFEMPPDTDLWTRVRLGFALADLDGDLVLKWTQWYASRPDYVQRMTERGGRYLFHIVDEVARRGLPMELALLPFIESAFNPQAMSSARASGMWQFIPSTGRDFSLRQNVFRDDRRDVLASTRAALDYLQSLHSLLGDWHLALAAYNWGQGNVQRAVARNLKAGLPASYADLRMPDETRNYLPKLQAVKNILARPEAFGLLLPPLANHPYFVSVPIRQDIDVDVAARWAGLSTENFRLLNPQLNKPVILAGGTPQILLPYDGATLFMDRIERAQGAMASWTAWVAPRTLSAHDAARQVGMTEARLREVNAIPARMLVKQGSTLLVPRNVSQRLDVSAQVADEAALMLAPLRVAAPRKMVKSKAPTSTAARKGAAPLRNAKAVPLGKQRVATR